MAFLKNQYDAIIIGRNSLNNSGFNGVFGCPTCDNDNSGLIELNNGIDLPLQKYFDIYQYNNLNSNIKNRILGDATGESGPIKLIYDNKLNFIVSSWHNNIGQTFISELPIFMRGGSVADGIYAGLFGFFAEYGSALNFRTYRLVLTPTV